MRAVVVVAEGLAAIYQKGLSTETIFILSSSSTAVSKSSSVNGSILT